MFQLKNQRALVTSLNVRSEKHGDENVVATDVDLRMDVDAAMLDVLAKGLRDALYRKPKAQPELVDGEAANDGPVLRFDGVLGTLKLVKDFLGYSVRMVWGDIASTEEVELKDCRVHKLSVTAKNGGTVELSLQIQARPGSVEIGELALFLQREVTLDLVPAGVELEKKAA